MKTHKFQMKSSALYVMLLAICILNASTIITYASDTSLDSSIAECPERLESPLNSVLDIQFEDIEDEEIEFEEWMLTIAYDAGIHIKEEDFEIEDWMSKIHKSSIEENKTMAIETRSAEPTDW